MVVVVVIGEVRLISTFEPPAILCTVLSLMFTSLALENMELEAPSNLFEGDFDEAVDGGDGEYAGKVRFKSFSMII